MVSRSFPRPKVIARLTIFFHFQSNRWMQLAAFTPFYRLVNLDIDQWSSSSLDPLRLTFPLFYLLEITTY